MGNTNQYVKLWCPLVTWKKHRILLTIVSFNEWLGSEIQMASVYLGNLEETSLFNAIILLFDSLESIVCFISITVSIIYGDKFCGK